MKKMVSVTIFTAMLTFFRILSGFIIAKIVAIYTGPAGMAMLGQVQSIITSLTGIVTAPVGNGIVRYTAENSSNGYDSCAKWWHAALHWAFGLLFLIVPIGVLFNNQISFFLFKSYEYSWVVTLCCIVLPLSILNTAFISVINGQKQYKKYVSVGFTSVTISTITVVILIYNFELKGALIAATINTAIAGLVVFAVSLNQPWVKWRLWFGGFDATAFKAIGGYVIMAVTSAVATPLALMLIRNILVNHAGWDGAGQWQAVWKISEVYLAIITLALSTYYLPQLAGLKTVDEIKKEINQMARFILPLVCLLALGVYLLRDVAIYILFTSEFKPARDLFSVQLVGDVVKICAWLYSFPMLAKGAVRWFVFSEIFFSITLVVLSWILISSIGVQGANWGYLINYVFYFLFVYFNLERFVKERVVHD